MIRSNHIIFIMNHLDFYIIGFESESYDDNITGESSLAIARTQSGPFRLAYLYNRSETLGHHPYLGKTLRQMVIDNMEAGVDPIHYLLRGIIDHADMEMMRCYVENGNVFPYYLYDKLFEIGYLPMIEYIYSMTHYRPTYCDLIYCLRQGHLDVAKWYLQHRFYIDKFQLYTFAAHYGYRDTIANILQDLN